MVAAWVGLGSNAGDRVRFIGRAIEELDALEGATLRELSSLYETSPVKAGGGAFINAVARVETGLKARKLLENLLAIEEAMGRVRRPGKTDPRGIDLDLLLCGEEKVEGPDLTLPHPRMMDRRFVMEPLAELDPDLLIPGTGLTAAQIARKLQKSDPDQRVRRLGTLGSLT